MRDHITAAGQKGLFCPAETKCGSCQYLSVPYEEQLAKKQASIKKLLGGFGRVHPICGMQNPLHYRNKVHAVFGFRKGQVISGVYEAGSHRIVPVTSCLIEDEEADRIITAVRELVPSFHYRIYNEDAGSGFLRHVLVRRGFVTGEILLVLVTGTDEFPSRANFVKAIRQRCPGITGIVQNINGRRTSMVLGEREKVLYGRGYIEDVLCGLRFRISSRSFYQVNPVQTELLYGRALSLMELTGKERVVDTYCGIGTIGLIAASEAGFVTGVELSQDAVRDAMYNAKANGVKNIRFVRDDAAHWMRRAAAAGERADVIIMDPPRTGSTKEFIRDAVSLRPKRIIYISCGPESLARDLADFARLGFRTEGIWPYDLFPFTRHVETVCLLSNRNLKPDAYVNLSLDMEDYRRIKAEEADRG